MALEIVLKGPFDRPEGCSQKLTNSLTAILFYSVFGYFFAKLKDIYTSEDSMPRSGQRRSEAFVAFLKVSAPAIRYIRSHSGFSLSGNPGVAKSSDHCSLFTRTGTQISTGPCLRRHNPFLLHLHRKALPGDAPQHRQLLQFGNV